jgi:hypothetical protein
MRLKNLDVPIDSTIYDEIRVKYCKSNIPLVLAVDFFITSFIMYLRYNKKGDMMTWHELVLNLPDIVSAMKVR